MIAASKLSICNQAIAKLPAAQIASIDEISLEARECRRFYPQAVSNMLEGPHDWSFAKQRARLALLATNDRESEWGYAYQLPATLASPLRVIPDWTGLGLALPVPVPGDPYREYWTAEGTAVETPYVIDGTTLYSNVESATLEFVVNDIEGIVIANLAANYLALELASLICVPVKKDSKREKELMAMAEAALQRAIADDRNRQPEEYGEYISESLIARHGGV